MIRQLTGTQWLDSPPRTEAELKIAGWLAAYGAGRPFVRFWQTQHGGRIACMGGTALACLPPEDREEGACFLLMQPDLRQVRCDPEFSRVLGAHRPGEREEGVVMRLDTAAPDMPPFSTPAPREVYPLLREVFGRDTLPPFEDWYVDVSHRLRHGLCRMAGVYEGEELAAVAMTTAEYHPAALIGGVATRPASRGRGYARRCVMTLAAALQKEDKAVWLSPKNAYAGELYARWGFVPAGRWATITWKD